MREKIIISRNHLFAQRLCAKIRCVRKFSELRYLKNPNQRSFFENPTDENEIASSKTFTIDLGLCIFPYMHKTVSIP